MHFSGFIPNLQDMKNTSKFSTEKIYYVKGLLDYAIKIAATWVACKKLHARIARPFTLRIQHRAIFKRASIIGFSTAFR